MDIWIIIPAILVIIGIVIGLIVFYVMRTKKKDIEKDTDYQAIFSVGFIWIPVGVVFMITFGVSVESRYFTTSSHWSLDPW